MCSVFHLLLLLAVLTLSAEDSETQLRWLKVFADNDIEILPSEEVRLYGTAEH